jgi:hypothetical protein
MFVWWTNQFWAMSLDLILIFDFLKLFVNMRLRISFAKVQIFINFGPIDQKLWRFEIFWRSLGKVGMCWSQPPRIDHMCKKR